MLSNDSDIDNNALSILSFVINGDNTVYTSGTTATIPSVGSIVIASDGAYTFIPF